LKTHYEAGVEIVELKDGADSEGARINKAAVQFSNVGNVK